MIPIFFDNIIFSLQNAGGISAYWRQIIQRILLEPQFNCNFIEYPNKNIFRNEINIDSAKFLDNNNINFPLTLNRFLNPKISRKKGIFHSSYYRITNNPKFINVTTLHDFTYEDHRKGLARFVHHKQKEYAIQNSKMIVCVSENTRDKLLTTYPKVNDKMVKVIYNGVNSLFCPVLKNSSELQLISNFSSGEYALYIGSRKNSYKNFSVALEACKIAKVPLMIVGGELISKKEESYLNELIGRNSYQFIDTISIGELNILYNHALCLLYPSISEGFGIPIIEAQKSGCPVISSNYSAIPEVAGNGAILLNTLTGFTLAEAMKEIDMNNTISEQLKNEGFKNAERFSWDKCYQQTKQVYIDIHNEYFLNK